MRVGPMPMIAADKLVRVLAKHGHSAEVTMSGDEFQPEEQATQHPRVEALKDLCYVDFDDAHLALIRPELVRLALVDDHDHQSTGDELDAVDWMCPTCGKTFEHQGLCPEHQIPLITFEDYAAAKRAKSSAMPPWMIIAIIGALAAVWLFTKR